jgi:hypothetical protein
MYLPMLVANSLCVFYTFPHFGMAFVLDYLFKSVFRTKNLEKMEVIFPSGTKGRLVYQ